MGSSLRQEHALIPFPLLYRLELGGQSGSGRYQAGGIVAFFFGSPHGGVVGLSECGERRGTPRLGPVGDAVEGGVQRQGGRDFVEIGVEQDPQ